MTTTRPSRWFLAALLACTIVGFGVRWVDIAIVRPVCEPLVESDDCFPLYAGPSDWLYGHLQGRFIGDGDWFVNPYERQPDGELQRSVGDPPLYQTFLGALSAVGLDGGQTQRHASAIVGLTTIPLLALLARRLAGEPSGVVAGVLAAVHPLLWINDGMLLSEAIYAPLIAATLLASVAFGDRPTLFRGALLSLVVTAAMFARGEAAMLLVLLVPVVILRARGLDRRQRVAVAIGAAAVAGAFVVPWNVWLNAQFEERVFMTSASGSVLSASACDRHFYGEPLALFIYCDVDVEVPAGFDESQQDALVRDAAVDYLGANRYRLPVVVTVRVARVWDLWGPAQNLEENIRTEQRGAFASRAGLAVYYALLPFAIVGLVSLRRRGEDVWPYVAIAIMVTTTAALTFGLTRYRVPADVALVVLAAVGIDAVVRSISSGRAGERPDREADRPLPTS